MGTSPRVGTRINGALLRAFIRQAAHNALPTIYGQREFMPAGGLISYATNLPDVNLRRAHSKGREPTDLPVTQVTKFELVINLKVAKGLDLAIPPGLLAIADEVIE